MEENSSSSQGHGDVGSSSLRSDPSRQSVLEGAIRLLDRLNVDGLSDDARLHVMTQNPASNYYWNKSIGQMTAGEVRTARVLILELLHIRYADLLVADGSEATKTRGSSDPGMNHAYPVDAHRYQ